MANQRPDPKVLQRKLVDIALRYDSQSRDVQRAKRNNRSPAMAAIRLSELTRWLEDTFGKGVELETSHANYAIVRIFAHHLGALKDASRRINNWVRTYAPWISPHDLERLIQETQDCPLKWSADKLAWKLRLTDAKRTELKIRTIGAIDCNKDQRKARRRKRDAEQAKLRRANAKANRVGNI